MPSIAQNPQRSRSLGRRRRVPKKNAPERVVTWGEKFAHLRGAVKGAPKDLSAREGFG
jgi:hypothetical protein